MVIDRIRLLGASALVAAILSVALTADSFGAMARPSAARPLSNPSARPLPNPAARPFYVFEGDSMSVESPRSWPIQLASENAAVGRGEVANVARRGTKTLLLHRDYMRQVEPIRPQAGRRAIYFLFMGSVDLARDTMPAQAIYANLSWAWGRARAEGFRVVAFTIKPATGITGSREQERLTLNKLILADPSKYDGLVRTELLLPNPTDRTVLLADGMHPTQAGHKRIADAVNRILGAKAWE